MDNGKEKLPFGKMEDELMTAKRFTSPYVHHAELFRNHPTPDKIRA